MAWDIVYYRTADGQVPGLDYLLDPQRCPTKVRATMFAVLDAVAAAPPPRFSGGGLWEAMHSDMHGYFEIRRRGLIRPAIAVITGMSKPWMTVFSKADYAAVRAVGDEHSAQLPRRLAA